MLPELQTVFGILLMSYNAIFFFVHVVALLSYITRFAIAVESQLVCQATINVFMLLTIALEAYATCILFHITYVMYHTFKLKSDMPKNLLSYYNYFVFGLLAVFAVIIIGYDLYSGNGKQAILPSGYCRIVNDYIYQTQWIKEFPISVNKAAQLSLLVIFLYYYCKWRNTVLPSEGNKNVASKQISQQLFRIVVAMGAVVGIARIILVTTATFVPGLVSASIYVLALLLQQCVVMASFMCTRKMSKLCCQRFCPCPAESAGQQ